MRARRATIYKDRNGEYRYEVQGANWRTIDASEEGFTKKLHVIERLGERWPDVEELVDQT